MKSSGHGGKRPGAGRKCVDGKSAREVMREIALDPTCIANAWQHAKEHPEFWLRCYEAGFGKPPQAIGLTVEDKRDSYGIRLEDGTVVAGPTASTTLSAGDLN